MEIQINKFDKSEVGTFFDATCGKTNAYVWFSHGLGTISVCCKNASHRAFGKLGRSFRTIDEALAGYKSSEMKAIIQAAADANAEAII